jgi:leucyl-tRNA synthetase
MIKMVSPFAPHVVEEIWEQWGKEGFASEQAFPQFDTKLIDEKAEYGEKFLISFMDDMRGLKRFLTERGNPEPETIEIFISPDWKYEVYTEAFNNGLDNLIGRVMKNPEMKKLGKPVPKYCQELMKMGGPPDIPWSRELEKQTIDGSLDFISNEMDAKILVIDATDSDHPKANAATPRRPGLNFIS